MTQAHATEEASSSEVPQSFNPLKGLSDEKLAQYATLFARNKVANILESYHGQLDALIELIQNAVDAIEKRWKDWDGTQPPDLHASDGEMPNLTVKIDCGNDLLEIRDNGTGLRAKYLETAFVPDFSPKTVEGEQLRGHKGVGTTFLAYGHNLFEFHTKSADLRAAYRITEGLTWAKNSGSLEAAPLFEHIDLDPELAAGQSLGSVGRVKLGQGTTYGSIKATMHNSVELWSHILRTYTAVGSIYLGVLEDELPFWARHLKVNLILTGIPNAGVKEVSPSFEFPNRELTTDQAKELQDLQNNPGKDREFELIYVERDHKSLQRLLRTDLQVLRESDNEAERAIALQFEEYEIEVYGSLAYRNTFYDTFTAAAIGNSEAKRLPFQNVKGGILASSVHMPVGEVASHINMMKPEERRRFFMLVHFNHKYRPDVGRKMIPKELTPLVGWLEERILKLLGSQSHRLIKDADQSTHSSNNFQQAQEQLKNDVRKIQLAWKGKDLLKYKIPVARAAAFEAEVSAAFFSLIADGALPGYEIRGIAGSVTRYDALFYYTAEQPSEQKGSSIPLGIHVSHFKEGAFSRTDKWMEFKVRLADLLSDFETADGDPQKKYFEQVDLAVVWQVPAGSDSRYEISPIDGKLWKERSYFGSTHFVRVSGSNHTVEVIELESLLGRLYPV